MRDGIGDTKKGLDLHPAPIINPTGNGHFRLG
jgi:hypothetical protein